MFQNAPLKNPNNDNNYLLHHQSYRIFLLCSPCIKPFMFMKGILKDSSQKLKITFIAIVIILSGNLLKDASGSI